MQFTSLEQIIGDIWLWVADKFFPQPPEPAVRATASSLAEFKDYIEGLPAEDEIGDFGYKIGWLAVKSTEPQQVASALGLKYVIPCTWSQGETAAHEHKACFVTAPIDGWVLCVDWYFVTSGFAADYAKLLEYIRNLSEQFGEVQAFGSYRIVGNVHWMKAVAGEAVRGFAWEPEQGVVLDVGAPTASEKHDFAKMAEPPDHLTMEEAREQGYWMPDEYDAARLIPEQWSVSPLTLSEREDIPSKGLVGELPETFGL